jgi:HlyD family secretion protein
MQATVTAAADLGAIVKHGRHRRLRRIAIRVAVILALAAGLTALIRWQRQRGAAVPIAYQTAPLARGEMTVSVTATGTLQPRNVIAVGSEVSGRIKRVLVDDNARVHKGQPLAQLDPDIFSAQLAQAHAIRDQAAAQVLQAQATRRETAQLRARDEELFARGIVSQQELESAVAAADRASAALLLASANLRQATAAQTVATTNLTKTDIRSPIDGIVLSHTIEEGQTVVAAFQTPVLFQIAEDLRELELSVDIDEADIGKVREQQAATFTVAAYSDRRFDATVTTVHNASRVVDRVVSYEAELAVDNRELLLRPGMTATAEIVVTHVRDELLVPSQALRFTPAKTEPPPGPHIWVLRFGAPIPVPVRVVGENETQAAIRSERISPGELVIVNTR